MYLFLQCCFSVFDPQHQILVAVNGPKKIVRFFNNNICGYLFKHSIFLLGSGLGIGIMIDFELRRKKILVTTKAANRLSDSQKDFFNLTKFINQEKEKWLFGEVKSFFPVANGDQNKLDCLPA